MPGNAPSNGRAVRATQPLAGGQEPSEYRGFSLLRQRNTDQQAAWGPGPSGRCAVCPKGGPAAGGMPGPTVPGLQYGTGLAE
jgi:hypothetical protein